MSWQDLPSADGVTLTVAPKTARFRIGSDCTPPLAGAGGIRVQLGDGEHAGWVRFSRDGTIGNPTPTAVTVPLALFDNAPPPCRNLPLVWRADGGAILARLPKSQRQGRKASGPQSTAADDGLPPNDELDEDLKQAARPIGIPRLFDQVVKEAWGAGIEVIFLSDDTAVVGNRKIPVGEVEDAIREALRHHALRNEPR
ncbi:MAG TPA: hypothetical protein VFA12_20305 [Stellaceae bacterium]|nr:hypothetical protein [Stellaceae bacterium]